MISIINSKLIINLRDYLGIIGIILVGFLSSQRFLFPELSALACIFPALIWGYRSLSGEKDPTLILISLISSIDLGGNIYAESPALLRYILYIFLLYFLIPSRRVKFNLRIIPLMYFFILLINTIFGSHTFDFYTFFRDFLSLLLLLIINIKSKEYISIAINKYYLLYFSFGLLFSEIINIWIFYDIFNGYYLNYSSMKFIIITPILYFLSKHKYIASLIMLPFIFLVAIFYSSKLLILTIILIYLLLYFRRFKNLVILFGVFLVLTFIGLNFSLNIEFDKFRIFSFIDLFSNYENLIQLLESLDPVRYAENVLFFNQPLYNIFFGNGLGSGLYDTSGDLYRIGNDQSSFSYDELVSSNYFRFHDSWVWFGLRFGLISYMVIIFWAVKGCISNNSEVCFWASMFLLAMLNSSFSISGLFLCSYFAIMRLSSEQSLKSNWV